MSSRPSGEERVYSLMEEGSLLIEAKLFAAMDLLRQTCYHNSTWNLCNLLLIFADRFGEAYDGKVLIKEKISQQMLSNLLGINRDTIYIFIEKHAIFSSPSCKEKQFGSRNLQRDLELSG